MSLEKWSIEEGWILCKMDGLQCSINYPQFKRGTTNSDGVPNGIFKEVAQSLRFKIKGTARDVAKAR